MKRLLPHQRLPILLALAATLAATFLAGCGGDKHRQVSPALSARLQQMLDSAVQNPKAAFPGTALYVSQPELGTWAGAAGQANIDPSTPMSADDRFRAGSIMKPFIAAAVLQLVEEGTLSLDDPLPAVLPRRVTDRFQNADRITVRRLLNHTSGIAEYVDPTFERKVLAGPRRQWEIDELLAAAASRTPFAAPGERYGYSNTNYNLLGLVIEQATGKPWRAVVRERIFDRLGLKHTSLPEPGEAPLRSGLAHGYQLANGKLRDVSEVDSSMAGAAGGNALVTTSADLARFLDALLAGELFEHPSTLEEMKAFIDAPDPGSSLPHRYGLGLERYRLPGGIEAIGHVGSTAGYFAFALHLPAYDIDIAGVTTSSVFAPEVLMGATERMIAAAS